MARKRRTYTAEFKQEAVRLVVERGLTASQVGRDLGVCKSVIRSWVRRAEARETDATPGRSSSAVGLEEEVRRLRRENAILREEREILKRATAFFAKESR